MALLLALSCRFGEARHPGPTGDDEDVVCIGACNTTGLNAAYGLVAQLPEPSIFGFSETHLTQNGVAKFRQGVKLSGSHKTVLSGAPAPLRPHSKVVGSHTGVALTSTFPCRPAPNSWAPEVWHSSRVRVSSVFLSPIWALVGVLYGHPTDGMITRALLEEMTSRVVVQGFGPQILVGDFNVEESGNPQVELWRQHGFEEVQVLHQWATGIEPRCTCKQATRKDYVCVSSEFHSLFREAILDHSFFPDHAVLYGVFRMLSRPEPRLLWQAPSHRPDAHVHTLTLPEGTFQAGGSPDERYLQLWHEFESRLSVALVGVGKPPLTAGEKGRADH